jgi:hypothetical protein
VKNTFASKTFASWTFNTGHWTGVSTVVVVPGTEWAVDAERLHWSIDTERLHWATDAERLHWKTEQ